MGTGGRSLRGPSGISSNSALLIVVSCLSSFYVIGRLWSSSTEVAYLKQEILKLSSVAEQQRQYLENSELEKSADTYDVLFYSVRPALLEIPPLNGSSLPNPAFIEDSSLSSSSSDQIVGQIDSIEAGIVTGWACSLLPNSKKPLKILLYVDDHLVNETRASILTTLPQVALHACHSTDPLGTKKPFGFSVTLPPLHPGQHQVRALVRSQDQFKELYHSPLHFIESTIKPSAEEVIRRKDAIIIRRNAELSALWQEVRSHIQWRQAENAAVLQKEQSTEEEEDGSERLLATLLVHSDPRDTHMRSLLRRTWMPGNKDEVQQLRDDFDIVVKFIMGPAGEMQKKQIEKEIKEYDDILIITQQDSLVSGSKKLLGALEIVTETLDADHYVVTRDTVVVNFKALVSRLEQKREIGNLYMGCFTSGKIVTKEDEDWFEPNHYRFGDAIDDKLQYPRHALGEFYVLSRPIARYLARNRAVMSNFAFEDTTVGTWMLSLNVEYEESPDFCCNTREKCAKKGGADKCLAFFDNGCSGICQAPQMLERVYKRCIQGNEE